MKRVFELLKKISGDTWAHFLVCLLLATSVGFWDIITYRREAVVAAAVAWFASISAGFAKEFYDGFFTNRRNRFSGADLVADIVGATLGFFLVWILG